MVKLPYLPEPSALPGALQPSLGEAWLERWRAQMEASADPAHQDFLSQLDGAPGGARLLESVFANSPFLSQCLTADIGLLPDVLNHGPHWVLRKALEDLKSKAAGCADQAELMGILRRQRRRVAFAVAYADMAGFWDVETVTQALSDLADTAIDAALCGLLTLAIQRGELEVGEPGPGERGEALTASCGLTVLGMGKLGARELNYSSDIDLIVIFDPEKIDYRHSRGVQQGMVRLTRDLLRALDERTAEGFVFRTDLRLRPDPGAMPLAIRINAALTYYESMGQNWERAAMIKARPVAGDIALGERFLAELRPFVWRKHLDFWAIQDVHSIKRQINAHKGGSVIAVNGHNVKLGRGGIREIEFFAQTQQLIWGGREPSLRTPRTTEALAALAERGHVDRGTAEALCEAYGFLRRLEHRLQMVEDQQTHSIPQDDEAVDRLAVFLGYPDPGLFRDDLLARLRLVEDHYAHLFEESPSLSGPGNLVFTGGEADPETLATLKSLGFEDPGRVWSVVSGWHHGRYRAVRSTRSRQLLTELVPTVLDLLAKTREPDQALVKFDSLLAGLPAGVQIFSLLSNNPRLLELVAEVMGSAPMLADRLARRPSLLEAVLAGDFFDPLPDAETLDHELREALTDAQDLQDVLDLTRRWANDRRFQVGVHILRHKGTVDDSGRALSDIAGAALRALYQPVMDDLARNHGYLSGSSLAVIAMGKMGGREMTVSSDLDLILLYELPPEDGQSGGPKPLDPPRYYARLAQRLINAVTAQTAEGTLYEIDMRLRPSGNAGPIATSLSGFRRYYAEQAWTWEHMALTRARVVAGPEDFCQKVTASLHHILTRPRDPDALLADVAAMRRRLHKEHPAKSIWSVKYAAGGLIDAEFLAQYLQLREAAKHPEVLATATQQAFANLAETGVLDAGLAAQLIEATRFLRQVQEALRLTVGPAFDADSLSPALQDALAASAGMDSFTALRDCLVTTLSWLHQVFVETIDHPAPPALKEPDRAIVP
ncbi:bifunctional [glutamine synthetase] adenylyltransferase/[glutamine synthetase]-adenylyl-L-tyrosine phosphorylase [Pelagibius sp.]|uniref:bifunctional [glutamine synthetase] adenylyltransferase/[glutamine synthetase]-adenylyl-L-tyrosine phosphorylase n=1 Tax=Pelagibius sp. TaxID=1931238 RepID=UPI00260E8E13|nr:bifunctional [glutamine synthetase] adenylyltransferase/[glutamine synthetase]-adenylyl-L-tyrosine phosphorylase [Pelagibius sp.]